MFNVGSNQILLLTILVLVAGAGTYVTYFRQQNTLDRLDKKIEARQEKKDEIESLRVDRVKNKKRLATARAQWRNRYTKAPDTVTSPEVVSYLTELTQRGFQAFNVTSVGPEQRDGYSAYRFDAEGQAYFSSLYRLIWRLENDRPFYRVQDLRLNHLEERTPPSEEEGPSLDVLVSFSMTLEAIYGIVEDLPRPLRERPADQALPVAQTPTQQASVPSGVGPDPTPSINPFYPLVFEQIPPNEEGRLNVEAAQLISIVDNQAVFATDEGTRRVREGDRVYLGTITEVDAAAGRVVARLNKGGLIERVERGLRSASSSSPSSPGSDPQ